MRLLRKSVYWMLFALFVHGCMGFPYSMKVANPLIQKNPHPTQLKVSYSLGGIRYFWLTHDNIYPKKYCYIYNTMMITNFKPFTDGLKNTFSQYYSSNVAVKVGYVHPDIAHHFAFNALKYQRAARQLDPVSPNEDNQPGTASVELEMEVVMSDHTSGPGFTKTYQLQAESPVSDMSTCEKYDKQGELSSQLMTEFFAQFQADLVAYLQKTK